MWRVKECVKSHRGETIWRRQIENVGKGQMTWFLQQMKVVGWVWERERESCYNRTLKTYVSAMSRPVQIPVQILVFIVKSLSGTILSPLSAWSYCSLKSLQLALSLALGKILRKQIVCFYLFGELYIINIT